MFFREIDEAASTKKNRKKAKEIVDKQLNEWYNSMVTREKSEKDDVFALLLFLFRKQRPLGQRLGAV